MRKSSTRKYKRNKKFPFGFIVVAILGVLTVFILSIVFISQQISQSDTSNQSVDTTKDDFIAAIVPYAQTLQNKYGILTSITVAQAILESDWGQSQLSQEYYNLFGVKAYDSEDKILLKTQEYVNGEWITIEAEFRVYASWEASMDDHALLFVNGVTWNTELYSGVLNASTYKEAAVALQQAGYATDPTYAEKLIELIDTYDLTQYDV